MTHIRCALTMPGLHSAVIGAAKDAAWLCCHSAHPAATASALRLCPWDLPLHPASLAVPMLAPLVPACVMLVDQRQTAAPG